MIEDYGSLEQAFCTDPEWIHCREVDGNDTQIIRVLAPEKLRRARW